MNVTQKLCDVFESKCYLDKNNILYKKIDGQWVGKPGIQVKPNGKGFQMKWQEDITQTDILT
jgi:hypothetical protein